MDFRRRTGRKGGLVAVDRCVWSIGAGKNEHFSLPHRIIVYTFEKMKRVLLCALCTLHLCVFILRIAKSCYGRLQFPSLALRSRGTVQTDDSQPSTTNTWV